MYTRAAAGKSKAKKAKHTPAVEPLQEGEEVTDTTGRKWKLVKLLSQSATELVYEGETVYMTPGQILEREINVQLKSVLFWDCILMMMITKPTRLLNKTDNNKPQTRKCRNKIYISAG